MLLLFANTEIDAVSKQYDELMRTNQVLFHLQDLESRKSELFKTSRIIKIDPMSSENDKIEIINEQQYPRYISAVIVSNFERSDVDL